MDIEDLEEELALAGEGAMEEDGQPADKLLETDLPILQPQHKHTHHTSTTLASLL